MRAVINISLPTQLSQVVTDTVSTGEYASKSEFFRHLLRLWMAGQLRAGLDESRREIETGGGKLLKSLKDLR